MWMLLVHELALVLDYLFLDDVIEDALVVRNLELVVGTGAVHQLLQPGVKGCDAHCVPGDNLLG